MGKGLQRLGKSHDVESKLGHSQPFCSSLCHHLPCRHPSPLWAHPLVLPHNEFRFAQHSTAYSSAASFVWRHCVGPVSVPTRVIYVRHDMFGAIYGNINISAISSSSELIPCPAHLLQDHPDGSRDHTALGHWLPNMEMTHQKCRK